jgi:hypothetical protein
MNTAMTSFDEYGIDMDRVIVDPDYRRRVIARLREDRQRSEAGGGSPLLLETVSPSLTDN